MKQKNTNIEIVRAIACVMVVVIHVANFYCRNYMHISTGEYIFSVSLNAFARVSVPCFFMISGALLLGKEEPVKKSMTKAWRFFIVLVAWTAIYYVFNTFYTHQECNWKTLLSVPSKRHLWYLYVLVAIYLVMPLLQALVRGMGEKLETFFLTLGGIWMVVLYVMSYLHLDIYYDLPIFGDKSYIYYFFLGYFIVKYLDRIHVKNLYLWLAFIGGNVVNIVLTVIKYFAIEKHWDFLLAYGNPLTIISAAAFFILILKNGKGYSKLLQTFCSCSFGIYLIHVMMINIYNKHVPLSTFPVYLGFPIMAVVVSGVSFLAVYLLRKVPVIKRIV